jgi:flagellar biosynthesis GTPase FlhF
VSPLALLLLRRAAGYALVFAVLLWASPKILTSFGILGPSLDEEIASAERSLIAARSYGASEQDPFYARAAQALIRARAAVARNERWQAKRAIAEARENAIDAQRAALATREESRKAAQKVVAEIDRSLNELEDLFADARKKVDKQEADRLFALMKSTRQRSAALVLFFEEQSYAKVVAGEREVRELLASTRQELLAARGGGRGKPS